MRFDQPLVRGTLLRRYKRFLADVDLDGRLVTAHCPNTGSMAGCAEPGMPVWLSPATNPARKLAWTWELVEPGRGVLAGVHTGRANLLVREAIELGRVAALAGYGEIRSEVRYGRGSRIDLLLTADGRPPCYLEVKNVTAAVDGGIGYFPDAVTERGARHLREMAEQCRAGRRAVLVFCVQRATCAKSGRRTTSIRPTAARCATVSRPASRCWPSAPRSRRTKSCYGASYRCGWIEAPAGRRIAASVTIHAIGRSCASGSASFTWACR